MTNDEEEKQVSKAVDALREHFDSVQIFVTRHDGVEVETGSITAGGGNWYARIGQIREWLARSDERTREYVRKNG